MRTEGVEFRTGVLVGALPKDTKVTNDAAETIGADELKAAFDAVVLTGGAEQSRDLAVPLAVLATTVTVWVDAADRVTVKLAVPPSFTTAHRTRSSRALMNIVSVPPPESPAQPMR